MATKKKAAKKAPTKKRSKRAKTATRKKAKAKLVWPAQAPEMRKAKTLTPYARNARIHSDAQISQIAASIKEWGFTNPILITPDGQIIAGHGRLLAAQQLSIVEVPCIVANGWTKAQIQAYVLADNQLATNAGWDLDLLRIELGDLEGDGFDINLIGFDDLFLDGLLHEENAGLTDDDACPSAPDEAKTQLGDVWILGEHRLMCGDSTDRSQVERLCAGDRIDMLLTDPPYNVALGMNETPEEAKKRNRRTDRKVVTNDDQVDEDFREFLRLAFFSADSVMKPGAVFYIWHADSEGFTFRGACQDIEWRVRQCLIWNKNVLVMGRQDYQWKHEPCLYGWKAGAAHLWATDRKQTTILEFDRPSRSEEHPTMKPVALIEYQLLNNTKGEDVVLDLFGGSGTTLIAAQKHGRRSRLMELNPSYCDVTVERWEDFTGEKAKLDE